MKILKIIFGFWMISIPTLVLGMPEEGNNTNWQHWLEQFKQEALADGISPMFFDQVFRGVTPDAKVIRFDHTQPEKRLTFLAYRRTRMDPYRISLGVKEYQQHRSLLNRIGNDYGVDPCFITALWGIETSYGRYKGNFPVIRSLATLAYDDRRSGIFRKELLIALHILAEGHVTLQDFKGEWAGASGHPQFLPSSWKRYAVDYDHDGRKDIWLDYSDAFASIANYLLQHGWQKGQPWGIEVTLPGNLATQLVGNTKTVQEWLALGVKPVYGELTPDPNLSATIIQPYGGPAFMVFKNFYVLLNYNNSKFYGCSVGYLANQICKKARGADRLMSLN